MRRVLVIAITLALFLFIACAPSRSALKQISLGMSKEEVINTMGNPHTIRVSIVNKFGQAIEILEYRVLKKG